jgi:hypothetical protein
MLCLLGRGKGAVESVESATPKVHACRTGGANHLNGTRSHPVSSFAIPIVSLFSAPLVQGNETEGSVGNNSQHNVGSSGTRQVVPEPQVLGSEQTDTPHPSPQHHHHHHAIFSSFLGEPPSGVKSFFYAVDPFKAHQYVRAPKKYKDINMFFAFLYFGGLVAFAAYAIMAYVNQQPVESTTLTDAYKLPPIQINISISCSVQMGCGGWQAPPITIVPKWQNPVAAACAASSLPIKIPAGTLSDTFSVGEFVDSIHHCH